MGRNWWRGETSSYPPFASTSSAACAVCMVRCFVTPVLGHFSQKWCSLFQIHLSLCVTALSSATITIILYNYIALEAAYGCCFRTVFNGNCVVLIFYTCRVTGTSLWGQRGIPARDHSCYWTELQGSGQCQQTGSLESFPRTKLASSEWSESDCNVGVQFSRI